MSFFNSVRIQARTETFINPTVPSREEVRKSNYLRRRSQLNSEGFHSKIWKPFICIGHPLELDPRSEIKVSLNNEDKDPNVVLSIKTPRSNKEQKDPLQRKEGEEFQRLNKMLKEEIKKSETVNFNVRVGQSFFGLIKKEKEDKANETVLRNQIKSITDINAPQCDIESDSENEFIFMEKDSSRPVTAASKIKVKSRAFTPVYNNIGYLPSRASNRPKSVYSSVTQTTQSTLWDIEESSLYRQLCSLQWLLEAMVREDSNNMPRISLSWTLKNLDNNLTSTKNISDIRIAWDKYVSRTNPHIISETSKKVNIPSLVRPCKAQNILTSNRSNENAMKDGDDLEDVFSEFQKKKSTTAACVNDLARITNSRMATRKKLLLKMRSVCDELDKDDNAYDDRKNLHKIRIGRCPSESLKTPQSTKLLPEDHYSDKLEHMVQRSRAKSAQLIDQRTTELRENVKNMSEYKMTVCLNKYKDVRTRGAFHCMLKEFRAKNDYHSFFTALDASKNKIIYAEWFLDLEDGLRDYLDNKRIERILSKIRQYSLITITKLNTDRFLTVLALLTDWEIRHPEISASIKFITDFVVPMTEEDFQLWLSNTFTKKKESSIKA